MLYTFVNRNRWLHSQFTHRITHSPRISVQILFGPLCAYLGDSSGLPSERVSTPGTRAEDVSVARARTVNTHRGTLRFPRPAEGARGPTLTHVPGDRRETVALGYHGVRRTRLNKNVYLYMCIPITCLA